MIGRTRLGTINGRISDESNGQPVHGVRIVVEGSSIIAHTDIRGRFTLPNVSAGKCILRCEKAGYKSLSSFSVVVAPGQTTRCECKLVPKGGIKLNEPVVLLPLRLEIRKHVGSDKKNISVAKYAVEVSAAPAAASRSPLQFAATSAFEPLTNRESEYWLRWYPDDVHYLSPVGKITDSEMSAWVSFYQVVEEHEALGSVKGLYARDPFELSFEQLEIFYGIRPGRLADDAITRCKEYDERAREKIVEEGKGLREALGWQDMANPDMKSAWIEFCREHGTIRARQIARHMLDGDCDFDENLEEEEPIEILMDQGMPIPTLPEEITLFTIKDGRVELLIERVAINREKLIVSPTDLEGSLWMMDFQDAIREGMGIIINEQDKVTQIDQADWMIVVGINETPDSRTVLEEILRRDSANGELAILAQDSPTSNTESAPTGYSELAMEAEAYLSETRMKIPAEPAAVDPASQISSNTLDSHRLSTLFKLVEGTLSQLPNAHLAEMTEATAMAVLLWVPCNHLFEHLRGTHLRQSFAATSSGLNDNRVGDFFVQNVRARGPLPLLRVGENPYGILPVISLRDWCAGSSRKRSASASTSEDLCAFINFLKEIFLQLSEDAPRVDAADDEIYETLLEILRYSAVSKRVDVRAFDSDKPHDMSRDPKYLDCALVRDNEEGREASIEAPYPETAYLNSLSHVNHADFNSDSIQIDERSPLLKRIISYYLWLIFPETDEPSDPIRLPEIDPATKIASLWSPSVSGGTFTGGTAPIEIPGGIDLMADAAALLKRVHPDKLEILLVETLDLFSHRLDAWLTGLANARLLECQQENTKSPPTGVYGWLEKPGKIETEPPQPEFVQAPSIKQAITAAILRNASIHNGTPDNSGPFQINLSSDQVRKGLWYMEGLRQGHLPGELLGYRLERMIHEEAAKQPDEDSDPDTTIQETDIFDLREAYPLKLREFAAEEGGPKSLLTVIDGEKFLKKNSDVKFSSIRARLNQIKDAAADIALCEVIHADDNVARRGGWLDFLEGDNLPPEEEFVRSLRTGDIQGTKLFLPIPSADNLEADEDIINPRIMADPILAHFCEMLMPDFGSKEVVANLSRIDGDSTRPIVFPIRELKMDPIDLVIGGIEEFKLRTRYYLLSRWKAYDPVDSASAHPFNILGEFPDFETSDELLNEAKVEIIRPVSSQDTSTVFTYIEKANLIRDLFHRNRSKNSLGTVHPEDLPILDQTQLERLDPLAGFELLSRRLRRISDRLVSVISRTVGETGELKRRHLVLSGLQECRRSVLSLREPVQSPTDAPAVEEVIDRLSAQVINLIDSDPDFKYLAEMDQILDQIDQLRVHEDQAAERLDSLGDNFLDLETRYGLYIEGTAQTLVANSDLLLLEISQFGLEKALMVLPDAPTVAASEKILKLFEQMLSALLEKLNAALFDSPHLDDHLQCLKVVFMHGGEVNQILLRSRNDPAVIEAQLRNRLPLTEAQSQIISSFQFQNTGYFEPLLYSLTDSVVTASSETYAPFEDFELSASTLNGKTAELISRIQAVTDKEAMVILTPYLLAKEDDHRSEWELDFSQLVELTGPTYLQEYRELRPAVRNLYELFDIGSELRVYEDKYYQRVDPAESSTRQEGNTDYLYLTGEADSVLRTKYLTVLLVDQWQEGIPNPEQSETTGVALRYTSPQAEAPNVLIVAVPPYKSNTESWNADLLANTLLETLELMQIRMVSSEAVNNYLIDLPALLFPPDKDGRPLFPSRERLLHGFDIGSAAGYVLASQLNPDELPKTKATAIRNEAPKIGGNNDYE